MHAKLKDDICFTDFSGKKHQFIKEDWIYVDIEKGIAFKNDVHFDVDPSEYQLVH